eukprot:870318-Prymnesium_polylepis.1
MRVQSRARRSPASAVGSHPRPGCRASARACPAVARRPTRTATRRDTGEAREHDVCARARHKRAFGARALATVFANLMKAAFELEAFNVCNDLGPDAAATLLSEVSVPTASFLLFCSKLLRHPPDSGFLSASSVAWAMRWAAIA